MRVNVYSQEFAYQVELVEKYGLGGRTYSAVMFPIHSSDMLHEDDQSGVTFWLPRSSERREQLAKVFDDAARMVRMADPEQ